MEESGKGVSHFTTGNEKPLYCSFQEVTRLKHGALGQFNNFSIGVSFKLEAVLFLKQIW